MKFSDINFEHTYYSLYIDQRLSLGQTAKALSISKTSVSREFKKRGLPTRTNSEAKSITSKLTPELIHDIYHQEYILKSKTLEECCVISKCSPSTLFTHFAKCNLPCRTQAEAMLARLNRKRPLLESFHDSYTKGELNVKSISYQINKSDSQIYRIFKALDLEANLPRGSKLSLKDIEQIISSYLNRYKSCRHIAQEERISTKKVKKVLQAAGILIRQLKEAINTAFLYGHVQDHTARKIKNTNFFNSWSAENAWVMGLFLSDGCLYENQHPNRNNRVVHLTSKDLDMLNQVAELLDLTNTAICKSGSVFNLTFSGDEIIDQVKILGLTQRKAFSVSIPSTIPQGLLRHFIRGYIDGDGCFYMSDGKLGFSVSSRSLEIISQIASVLYEQADIRLHTKRRAKKAINPNGDPRLTISRIIDQSGKPIYQIQTTHKDNLVNLIIYLYEGVPPNLCLSRKRALCEKYFPELFIQ
jgi:intein-encoded DNA endonuclease-like protein